MITKNHPGVYIPPPTIKPAHSLETSGIYSFTRNPMYLSLVCLYKRSEDYE